MVCVDIKELASYVIGDITITPFETYRTYLALKRHFTSDYDYFRYNGKVNASVKSFENRRDRFYFEKIAKRRDPTGFMLSNLLANPSIWVGDLVGGEGSDERYSAWLKRNQSLTYSFKDDLSRLADDFDSNFRASDGGHPPLLRLFLSQQISLETLIILVHMTKCFSHWARAMEYDPVWREVRTKIIKYQPFMKYDIAKFKAIVVDKFQET